MIWTRGDARLGTNGHAILDVPHALNTKSLRLYHPANVIDPTTASAAQFSAVVAQCGVTAALNSPEAVLTSIALNRLEKLSTDEYIIAFGPNRRQFFATPHGYAA